MQNELRILDCGVLGEVRAVHQLLAETEHRIAEEFVLPRVMPVQRGAEIPTRDAIASMLTPWKPSVLNASAEARAICALRSLGRRRTVSPLAGRGRAMATTITDVYAHILTDLG